MITHKKSVLYVYSSHLGLPSIDYKCLQALLLVKMKLRHNIEVKSSGFYITPYFPMLECDGQYYTTQTNLLKKLEELIDIDVKDNIKKSRIEAYKALTMQILEPYIAQNIWGNEKNCQYLLKLYSGEKYFPFRLIYMKRMNNYIQDVVLQNDDTFNDTDTNVNIAALESYLTDISHLLTINKYLLGNQPSTLDAFVCGYLVPIHALNLPDKTLKTIMQRYDIIIKYLINYLKHYNIKIQPDLPMNQQEQEDSDRASIGLLATAGFVSLSLMIGYGVLNDIFRFK